LRELEKAAERGILSLETTSYLLTLHRKAVLASIGRDGVTGVREDLAAYDARLYNLLTNVITADIKSFMRRLQAWSVAKARQSSLKSRMAKGELDDQDEPIYDPTGAVLWDAGELIELTLRDFYSDKDLKIDELWQKARSVKL
jgi:hypothetical protein